MREFRYKVRGKGKRGSEMGKEEEDVQSKVERDKVRQGSEVKRIEEK